MSARPVTGSRSSPVMDATERTCPTFSATRTRTTGTKRPATAMSRWGAVKVGSPTQSAACTLVKSTSSRSTAVT